MPHRERNGQSIRVMEEVSRKVQKPSSYSILPNEQWMVMQCETSRGMSSTG